MARIARTLALAPDSGPCPRRSGPSMETSVIHLRSSLTTQPSPVSIAGTGPSARRLRCRPGNSYTVTLRLRQPIWRRERERQRPHGSPCAVHQDSPVVTIFGVTAATMAQAPGRQGREWQAHTSCFGTRDQTPDGMSFGPSPYAVAPIRRWKYVEARSRICSWSTLGGSPARAPDGSRPDALTSTTGSVVAGSDGAGLRLVPG